MKLSIQQSVARPLFVATILAGSFLLFLVQPMIARMALPRLGGAPNVWNSAMIVYQSLLLAGYAYAHRVSQMTMPRQAYLHIGLMVVFGLTLPLSLYQLPVMAPGWEVLWVPLLLVMTVGPVFFIVSAQAPLMQRWFSGHKSAGEPWALYAASNIGSFVGLIAYPLVAEPLLSIDEQSWGWSIGYGLLILLVIGCAYTRRTARFEPEAVDGAPSDEQSAGPSWRRVALWIALAAVPSGLMLSTTTHLTTDIFAMPLLWVIPLGLYLLSFVVAFSDKRTLADFISKIAPPIVLVCGGFSAASHVSGSIMLGITSLLLLFVVATTLHARFYSLRPDPSRLTGFYLAMSVGGALGGAFTAIVAPIVFDWVWEHPLLILAAAALMPLPKAINWRYRHNPDSSTMRIALIVFVVAGIGLAWMLYNVADFANSSLHRIFLTLLMGGIGMLLLPWRYLFLGVLALTLLAQGGWHTLNTSLQKERSRSYFGIYTIADVPEKGLRQMVSGTTLHGQQFLDSSRRKEPSTYYGPDSGVGLALTHAQTLYGDAARVGIVGLGTGTLACYKQGQQPWTFYEIDPAVVEYSKNKTFTYLADCTPDARIVVGDARINLEAEPRGNFDILVIDAFTSDAIPLHLLTREAFAIYLNSLSQDGIVMLHISNRYIDLEPAVAAIARDLGLSLKIRNHQPKDWAQFTPSKWVVLSRNPQKVETLAQQSTDAQWDPMNAASQPAWTDDYASILPYIRWGKFLGKP